MRQINLANISRTTLKLVLSRFTLLCICLHVYGNGYSQLSVLKNVQQNRFTGKAYIKNEMYDSAYLAISKFVENEIYANPYDYLNYSLCNYKIKDTFNFQKYLTKAVEGGVDSGTVKNYLRKLTGNDKIFLDNYLNLNYEQLRKKGWLKYDTVLINEVNSIERLDQYARNEFAKLVAAKTDSNYKYLGYLQKQADSINYVRVASLFGSGKFPGYHNCGAFASLMIILIHLGDNQEDQWQFLYDELKTEVLAGNIMPLEVATITDNHFQRGRGKLCSYYGQWTGRTTELCDCKNVDNYRAIIGLEDLQSEYKANGKTLQECYESKSAPEKK